MPNFDRTGPYGQGPMTGRGFGPCGGFTRGRGMGRGFGRALGFKWTARNLNLDSKDEKRLLQEELKDIDTERSEIEKRLKELKD